LIEIMVLATRASSSMSMWPMATPVRCAVSTASYGGDAGGHTEAQDLLQLELDGRADLGELAVEVIGVRDRRRELAGLGKTGPEQTRNLLDAVHKVS
jgi:hypothetical protein